MIDLVVCVVMVLLPAGIVFVSLYSQVEWSSTVTILAFSFGNWYPLVSHMILMWFIAPYRRALIRMFKGRGRTVKDKSFKSLQLSVMSK
ncbi:hypothetical protein Ddc_18735 [Ditylenchus destructor]|nr:hypothetical protein Ddc_18735 [Ditylenchus destructor]